MLRRIEPLTAVFLVLCVGWTLLAKGLDWTYDKAGALRRGELWDGEIWRLLTAAILHDLGGWWHLVLNGLGLLIVGPIVARECGRPVYFVSVLFGAQAGWAASLLWYDHPHVWNMGISGGLLALIGLLLAVEWAISDSWRGFFRQRNAWVLILCIVVGAAMTHHFNRVGKEGTFVSQAGHAGGLAFGLLFGLAFYARPRARRRPVLGAAAVVLLGVAPVAYLSYPILDLDFLLFRGQRAFAAEERDAAERWYAQARRIDEAHPMAGARLALLRDDPAYLDGLRKPEDMVEAYAVLRAYLALAGDRLASAPDEARALAERAVAVEPGNAGLWFDFGERAEAGGRPALANLAFTESERWARLGGRRTEAWKPASRTLAGWYRRLEKAGPDEAVEVCLGAIRAARSALGGLSDLSDLDGDGRESLEGALRQLAVTVSARARELEPGPEVERLFRGLANLFRMLANNGRREVAAQYLFHSALCLWRGGEAEETVANRFKGALFEARERGDAETAALAERWFVEQGLEVPDLAEDRSGG